jgi:hypothetical protein
LIETIMGIKPLDRLLFAQGGACFFCSAQLPRAEATVEHLVAQANGGSNADHNCVACCHEINMILGSLSLKEKLRIVLNQKGKFICPKRTALGTQCAPPITAAQAPAAIANPKPKVPVSCRETVSAPSHSAKHPSSTSDGLNGTPAAAITAAATPKPSSPKQKAPSRPSPPYYAIVLKDLRKRGEARPKRLETLRSTIRSAVAHAKGSLTEPQLDALLKHLQTCDKVRISGTTVDYSL